MHVCICLPAVWRAAWCPPPLSWAASWEPQPPTQLKWPKNNIRSANVHGPTHDTSTYTDTGHWWYDTSSHCYVRWSTLVRKINNTAITNKISTLTRHLRDRERERRKMTYAAHLVTLRDHYIFSFSIIWQCLWVQWWKNYSDTFGKIRMPQCKNAIQVKVKFRSFYLGFIWVAFGSVSLRCSSLSMIFPPHLTHINLIDPALCFSPLTSSFPSLLTDSPRLWFSASLNLTSSPR